MRQIPRDAGLNSRIFLTMFLLAALYLLFAWVLYNSGVGFTSMLIIVGAMMLAQYFFSDRLVLLSTGAKEVGPEQAPELHAVIDRLAIQAGVPKPRVAVVPSQAPNAFATGRSPSHAAVAVTEGLLNRLNSQEVEAVLAHEMSHVRNWDMAVMTVASFFAMLASYIVQFFFFFGGGYGGDREDRGGGAILVYLVSLLVWVVSFFLIRALSRYREYAADRGSAYLTGAPGNLRSALVKISNAQATRPQALEQNDAVAAFLIFPSLKGIRESFGELASTHPSLENRLAYLQQLEQEII
jgi:heat shock protein HtpX